MTKYKIFTREGRTLIYDVDACSIVLESTGESVVPQKSQVKRRKTFDNVERKTLRILMGTKCNFNCSYCSQAYSRKDHAAAKARDVDEFLNRFDDWASELNITKFEFWGGEPLVYIKTLRKLIPELRKKYPDAYFSIISNGSLLTDEIGDFLAENRVAFAISHDTYGHEKSRGSDPLADPKKLEIIKRTFKKINKKQAEYTGEPYTVCGFNLVFSKYCHDPIRAQQWLNEKFGEPVPLYCDPVMGTGAGNGNESVLMNAEEQVEFAKNVFRAGMSEPEMYPVQIGDRGMKFIYDLANKKKNENYTFCGITTNDAIVVDLKGNLYPCQNYVTQSDVRANVYRDKIIPPSVRSTKSSRECCDNCPVVMLCHGGCPLAKGNGFVETCEMKFAYCLGIFASAIKRMTGLTPYKIEGKIVRPAKELIETEHGKAVEVNEAYIPQYEE